MLEVIFAINRYERFMEHKTIIGTFCDCTPSKRDIQPHQKLTGFYKNNLDMLDELQDTQSIKR